MERRKMSRFKTTKAKSQKKSKEWPLIVYMWIVGLAVFGYIAARIALFSYPHPLHWASGLAAGLIGVPVGWAWYRWRGDII
jgi:hypothetical protein